MTDGPGQMFRRDTMPILGGIADDLTGATTTGVLLARSGARTAVYIDEEYAVKADGWDDTDAVIISTGSRALAPCAAYEKVRCAVETLKEAGVRYYQKRIDTTLRGSIGSEIDAMLDHLQDTIAVMVPAMPSSRRILAGGYSIIDGTALVNTPAARDVRTPVTECYIPSLIAGQTKRKTAFICLSAVLGGADCILSELQTAASEGAEIVIVDAVSAEDVDEIAKACIASGRNILSVDPGAFTAALAYRRGLISKEAADLPDTPLAVPGKTVLIAAGSATSVTKRQMEVLEEEGGCLRVSVNPHLLMDGSIQAEQEILRAADTAAGCINSNDIPRAVLLETALHGDVLDLADEEERRGYARGRCAELINEALGRITAMVMEAAGGRIAGIYATGGDTLLGVCRHLGSGSLSVFDYVIPQADVARLSGIYAGLPVIGKGGLTGNDDTAVRIVERLYMEYGRKAEREV